MKYAEKEYIELIQCYCDAGNNVRAREIAEQGLKQCKGDLTEFFTFLLREAKALAILMKPESELLKYSMVCSSGNFREKGIHIK